MRALLAAAVALAALSAPAGALACEPREAVLARLARSHGEAPAGAGLATLGAGAGAVVEIVANPATGTWTLLVTRPDGASCAVSAGEGWRPARPEPIPEGDPT